MAPPHMMRARSKPAFQPRAGKKPVASRVEKKKSDAKTAKLTFFSTALTFRPKEAAPTNMTADPMVLDSPEPALTDPVSEEPLVAALVNQDPSETALTDPANEESIAATDQVNQNATETAVTDRVPGESVVADVVMQDSPTPAPINAMNGERLAVDQVIQNPPETALTDQVNEGSPVPNAMSATQTADNENEVDDEDEPEPELVERLFNLDDAIPRVGFQFRKDRKDNRFILDRWKNENIVAAALYPDMDIIHKSKAEGVLSPIFHQAAKMIEDGTIQEHLARFEGLTSSRVWKWFIRKLWVDSKAMWPRRLTTDQFVRFFSALAEARWREENQPKKSNGEQPGLLAQNVSLFLNAAEEEGLAWSNGGKAFGDED